MNQDGETYEKLFLCTWEDSFERKNKGSFIFNNKCEKCKEQNKRVKKRKQ